MGIRWIRHSVSRSDLLTSSKPRVYVDQHQLLGAVPFIAIGLERAGGISNEDVGTGSLVRRKLQLLLDLPTRQGGHT